MSQNLYANDILYRNLFETMTQGVVYQNSKGEIISANKAAEEILGLTFGQMTGKTSMDPQWKSVHEDGSDFPGDTHPAMEALKTGKKIKDVVMGVFNPKNETYKWININAIPEFREGERRPYQVYATFEDITERKQAEEEREKLIKELQEALKEIKTLRGILPICSHCKKVRDDKGYWNQIEDYLHEHSEAEFSHGICQECAKKYFPDMDLYDEDETKNNYHIRES